MTDLKMTPCPVCCGNGFSGHGSGYDDVCDHCGGLREFPQDQPEHDDPRVQAVIAAAHDVMNSIPPDAAWPEIWVLADALLRYETDQYVREGRHL